MTEKQLPSSLQPQFCGWTLFFFGICMGAADLVPGISGGTIAFILGFYQPLLESLKTLKASAFCDLLKGRWRAFHQQVAWKFILVLLAGMMTAFASLANLFQFMLADEVYRVYFYATFLGLILASFVFCLREVKVWNEKMIIALCAGSLIAYLLTEATPRSSSEGNYSVSIQVETNNVPLRNYDAQQNLLTGLSSQMISILLAQDLLQDNAPVYNQHHVLIGLAGELVSPYRLSLFNGKLVISGILAVCALLLPGISGSYILTLLGVYPIVIEALADFLNALAQGSFHTEAFAILWSLSLGVIVGALGFARFVSRLLKNYPDESLAMLSGFMIGAIRSIWPFWSYEYILLPIKLYKGPQLVTSHPFFPSWDSPLIWQAALCAVVGFSLIVFLKACIQKRMLIK